MKRNLILTIIAVVFGTFSTAAQSIFVVQNAIIDKASDDGRYLASADQGTVVVFDSEESTYQVWESGEDGVSPYYCVGLGNVFSKDGTLVGGIDFNTPAYYKNGEWHRLPITEEDANPGKNNSADGITPDGKRICGGVAPAAMGLYADNVMLAPVIWEMDENGEYGMYKSLPYPTKDFTGRMPQYVTARYISDDGKTIAGHVVDWSGFFPMPIVYHEQENGEWTYELFGREFVYDVNVTFPEYPSYEPRYPEAADYMTDEEREAYEDALVAYDQAVEDYWLGDGEYPEWPNFEDYMSAESMAAYNAAVVVYQGEYKVYSDSVDVFNKVFYDTKVVYNVSYEFNNLALSHDGKYYASTLRALDEEHSTPGDPWGMVYTETPLRFDLTDECKPEVCERTNAMVSNFMNDGSLLVADPVNSFARNTYIMPPGTTSTVSLYDYVQSKSPEAAQLMADNLTFESYSDGEAVFTGTASSNGEGNVIYGWLVNEFAGVDWWYLSYCLKLDSSTGMISISTEGNAEIVNVTVHDISGNLVATSSSLDAVKNLGRGIFIVTTTTADGQKATRKIVRH